MAINGPYLPLISMTISLLYIYYTDIMGHFIIISCWLVASSWAYLSIQNSVQICSTKHFKDITSETFSAQKNHQHFNWSEKTVKQVKLSVFYFMFLHGKYFKRKILSNYSCSYQLICPDNFDKLIYFFYRSCFFSPGYIEQS